MYIKENKTRTLPEFDFEEINGILKLTGKSISNEASEFYKPILDYVREIVKSLNKLEVTIDFEYFNTKTARELIRLFDIVKDVKDLTINWYYEEDDESMLEAGEDYEDIIGIKFNFKEKLVKPKSES